MVKAATTENKDLNPKMLSTPKDGFIQKKKNQKFKQTPAGKVSLINGSKASNNNNMKKQQLQKQQNTSPQKLSVKNKGQNKVNSPKSNKPQSKKELSKKGLKKSKANESDSDEDINEGVVLKEEELMEETDDTESEGESDEDVQKKVPNILGTSLADDTEEDDEEFKVEGKKGKLQVNKGVKMFKGLKPSNKSNDSFKSTDTSGAETSLVDDSEDDEDDDDEEEEEMEDDDNEDVKEEEDDDDEDVEEEEDDDDEEEEEDDEESENEGEESVLGTKALLSQSLADDDDDEDFVEPEGHEEDDDISDEDEEEGEGDNTLDSSNQSNSSKNANTSIENLKEDSRTIFVGNLPKEVTDKQLKKLFKKFGDIDTIRIRGIVPSSPEVSKKVAAITKKIHPKLKSVYAYVRFVSEESAKAALAMNGTVFEGNHIRVDAANKSEKKYDGKKSVFLGNLPFNVDIETVWKHFEKCGEIDSVHVVKDNRTGLSKGIGYVNFKTEDAVALAFELNGTTIINRDVIVKPYIEQHKGKQKKRSHSGESDKHGSPRKQFKQNSGKPLPAGNKENAKKAGKEQKFDKKQASPQQTSTFQGQKADKNKKKTESKVDKKKKILAKKLTAKSKKPTN